MSTLDATSSVWAGAEEIAAAVQSRRISARSVAEAHLARIAAIDPHLNSYILVDREGALAAADAVDARVSKGVDPGPLCGVPVGLKDLLVTRGLRTTAGSPDTTLLASLSVSTSRSLPQLSHWSPC